MKKKVSATPTLVNTIQEKQSTLAKLQAKSDKALDVVTSTINSLTIVNTEIDATISEITDLKSQLQSVQDDLSTTRDRNSKIVEKFRSLIEV